MTSKHAVILGIDGVPLEAFNKLFSEGAMPFTKHLWPKLWVSELRVKLPYTLSSWTSISTGVNPGKHGIFDFMRVNSNGKLILTTREVLERPTINEIVSTEGMKSITINVPMTYPPFIRNNKMIVVSDWTIPEIKAWPQDEENTVRKYFEHERIKKYYSLEEYFEAILKGLEERVALIEYYFTNREWNLFYTVISETDWVFHKVFGELMEGKVTSKAIAKIFSLVDKLVKTVYHNMPENTLLTLCSDHGFMVAHETLNANVLLKKMGLLKLSNRQLDVKSRLIMSLARILPSRLIHKLKYTAQVVLDALNVKGFNHATNPVDYLNSKAFMTISYNLYINPLLSSSERSTLRELVIKELSKYTYMFEWLGYGKDYFWGPYVNRAPDIVLIPRKGYNVSTRVFYRNIVEKGRWYVHSTRGFIALNINTIDVDIRSNVSPSNYDIAPTILVYLGIPLDPDMDGEPLISSGGSKLKHKRYLGVFRIAKRISLTSRLQALAGY